MDSGTTPQAPAPAPFAEPTPLGLIGLAIACAALTPIAFGASLTPQGFETAAVFCVLFGGGCQLLAGLMAFANRNLHGGTLLTAFSMNWFLNGWALHSLAGGVVPDAGIVLSVDALSLVVFAVMTWAFGYFGKLLFALLLDVTLLYVFRLANGLLGTHVFAIPIGVCTVLLAVIALWIAFAILLNPVAGRRVFPFPGPAYLPRKADGVNPGT